MATPTGKSVANTVKGKIIVESGVSTSTFASMVMVRISPAVTLPKFQIASSPGLQTTLLQLNEVFGWALPWLLNRILSGTVKRTEAPAIVVADKLLTRTVIKRELPAVTTPWSITISTGLLLSSFKSEPNKFSMPSLIPSASTSGLKRSELVSVTSIISSKPSPSESSSPSKIPSPSVSIENGSFPRITSPALFKPSLSKSSSPSTIPSPSESELSGSKPKASSKASGTPSLSRSSPIS